MYACDLFGLSGKRASIYGLLTKCEVKMAGYWPSSFLRVNGPRRILGRSINTQEKNEGDIQPSRPNKLGQ